jgi:predicted RNA-binding Zn-ribbon protein involved in translation (DUF1610 family)
LYNTDYLKLKFFDQPFFLKKVVLEVIKMKICSSCNKEVNFDFTEFKCPKCEKTTITRCDHCKTTTKEYKCSECGFIGP